MRIKGLIDPLQMDRKRRESSFNRKIGRRRVMATKQYKMNADNKIGTKDKRSSNILYIPIPLLGGSSFSGVSLLLFWRQQYSIQTEATLNQPVSRQWRRREGEKGREREASLFHHLSYRRYSLGKIEKHQRGSLFELNELLKLHFRPSPSTEKPVASDSPRQTASLLSVVVGVSSPMHAWRKEQQQQQKMKYKKYFFFVIAFPLLPTQSP